MVPQVHPAHQVHWELQVQPALKVIPVPRARSDIPALLVPRVLRVHKATRELRVHLGRVQRGRRDHRAVLLVLLDLTAQWVRKVLTERPGHPVQRELQELLALAQPAHPVHPALLAA